MLTLRRLSISGIFTALLLLVGACSAQTTPDAASKAKADAPATAAAPSPAPTGNATNPQVEFTTNLGKFTVELYPAAAPKTVDNFLHYVKTGHYNGTIFHRVISNFMVQGGGFDASFVQKPTQAPIAHEGVSSAKAGLKNTVGTLAMARTGDPNSATAQFFVNVVDNDFLNHTAPSGNGWGYVVFGKVISGMDVIEKIRATPTGAAGPFASDVPKQTITIQSAKQIK